MKYYSFRQFSVHVILPASGFSYHLSPRPWYQHASSYATAWEWLINKEILLLAKVTKPLCVKEFLDMGDLKTKHLMQ